MLILLVAIISILLIVIAGAFFLRHRSVNSQKPIIIQSIPRSMTINETHQKISKEFELLEKLNGNVEKEKAQSLMNYAEGKAKPVE